MFKRILAVLCLATLIVGTACAEDWFDDLWGTGGTYEWLRNDTTQPVGITKLDPEAYYWSSDFYDDFLDDYVLFADEYIDATGYSTGVYIDTDTFANRGYIRVEEYTNPRGIYNEYDNGDSFTGSIANEGAIYVKGYGAVAGMEFYIDVVGSEIENTGDILAEVNLDEGSESYANGILFSYPDEYGVIYSTVVNEGTIAAIVDIDADYYEYSYGRACGICSYPGVYESEIENTGNILAEVSIRNLEYDGDPYYGWGDATGIGVDFLEYSSITNEGDITARVNIEDAWGYGYVEGYATGIYVDEGIYGSEIENSGDILAEVNLENLNIYIDWWDEFGSYGYAAGIDIYDGELVYSSITNDGNITARVNIDNSFGYVEGSADGIYVYGDVYESEIINTGDILAEANLNDLFGGNYDWESGAGYADGIYIGDEVEYSLIRNEGDITARVNIDNAVGYVGGESSGIYIDEIYYSEIENSGNILAEVNVNNLGGDDYGSSGYGEVAGLYLYNVGDSSVTNEGTITAKVNIDETESYAYGDARGIFVDGYETAWAMTGTSIISSGDILAEVNMSSIGWGYGEADAYGFYFGNDVIESTVTNSGDTVARVNIDTTYSDVLGSATGMYFEGDVGFIEPLAIGPGEGETTITNSGSILAEVNLTNIGDDGEGDDSYGESYGIYFDSLVTDVEVKNTGDITARTTVENTADDVYAYAGGIYKDYPSPCTISGSIIANEGNILAEVNLTNIGDESFVQVYGIDLRGYFLDSVVNNSGNINIALNLADTYVSNLSMSGISAGSADEYSSIVNEGNITVSASVDDESTVNEFVVSGIQVWNSEGITVDNSGVIAMDVEDLGETDDSIYTTATATAVMFGETLADFYNTGAIWTSGNARALSLYNSYVNLQDGFGYVFHGDPTVIKRPIYIDGSSDLDLNGVDLLVYGDRDTVLDWQYYLITNNGDLYNEWGDLVAMYANPDIAVNWYDEDRGDNSAVIFTFAPLSDRSPATTAGAAALAGIYASQAQFAGFVRSNINGGGFFGDLFAESDEAKPVLLASADPMFAYGAERQGGHYKNGMCALPYYTKVNDSGLGADITSTGILVGLEKKFGSFLAGLDAGYGSNDVDFTSPYRGSGETQDVYSAGLYGIYQPVDKNWFASFSVNYHYLNHDYDGLTGVDFDLEETDEYDSDAFVIEAEIGPKVERKNWGIYPSAGLRWTYLGAESRHTKVEADPSWSKYYGAIDEEYLHLLAGIDAYRAFGMKDSAVFALSGGVRLEQVLTDNEISVVQTLQGTSGVTDQSVGETSVVGDLALSYISGRLKTKFGCLGQFNDDYEAYSAYIQVGVAW